MTKPIELGLKTAESPKPARSEKSGPAKDRKEAGKRSEAEIMSLPPSRTRIAGAKPEIIDQIGQQLGRVYNDVLKQPVPERFLDLLQALEAGATTPTNLPNKRGAQSGGRKKDLK